LFGLATTYHRAGQLQLARPLYGELLSVDPHNVEGLNNFLVLLADESPKDALAELEHLEKSHPGLSIIPAQMAIIHEKMGDYDAAMEKMNIAISLSPENLKYRYNMAIILDKKGDWQNAAIFYKQLLTASERGEKIAANLESIQQRMTFISTNKPKG
jgi:Flp pilus assembly protein TadD